ncbi:MAG TPA: 3-isopropylmalate dehydratase small subunit [Sulfolobales archaeon]|nr:3-isopropylmalate dehydratase small subunit [Sulfolobales archaeon]
MPGLKVIEGKAAPLPIDNIDTDQIIPAQFLKISKREGLGRYLFYRWRYDDEGKPKEGFVLDDDRFRGASILVTGRNFGIGSSREHAVWALVDFGIRAVISTSFGDIFYENAARNGLACIKLGEDIVKELLDRALRGDLILRIDLERKVVEYEGRVVSFEMDESARKMLILGLDEIGITLQSYEEAINAYEERLGRRFSINRGIFTTL